MFDRRERGRGLVALAGAGTGQRRVRIVRAAAVRDTGGHAVRVRRRVRVLSLAVAGVVRGVAGERAGSDLAGPLRHSLGIRMRLETRNAAGARVMPRSRKNNLIGSFVSTHRSVLTNTTTTV